MTPKELLEHMSYESSAEREDAQKYITLKGIVQYQRVINYSKSSGEKKPAYKSVSDLYKYDKRLRDKLYIYLATIEEFMRACIGNKFEDNEGGLIKTTQFTKKQSRYHSVSLTLEQLTLKDLNDMILSNKSIFQNLYDLNVLEMNLNALRILRNKVSHHNFLLAETYDLCSVDGKVDNTLKHNIINLMYLLPSEFRQGFVTSINDCAKELNLFGREVII